MRLVEPEIVWTRNVNRAAALQNPQRLAQHRALLRYMFHHLVHGDQIESAVCERQAFADTDCEHLMLQAATRNLNGTNPASLADAVGLNAKGMKASLAAGHH